MTITDVLFSAFLKCPTKCWLRAHNAPPSGNAYAEWVLAQNKTFRVAQIDRLLGETAPDESPRSPSPEELKSSKWRLALEVGVVVSWPAGCANPLPTEPTPSATSRQPGGGTSERPAGSGLDPGPSALQCCLHAVERVPAEGRGKAAQFVPIRCIFLRKLTKDDKLLLAFDAFVLAHALGRDIAVGEIIHGDEHTTIKVKTTALAGEVRKRIESTVTLLSSPRPPDLVLNRHCTECEFQARCREKAIETDDLSLLAGMSVKERQKLRSKGIFTVTQLSYTFRPRRRPKRQHDKREKYHHSLKALAIREKKIHIVGSPELKIDGTPVYLDVEGLPDRDFYYLIGLRIGNGDAAVQHSLWADSVEDEGNIWREFLAILETVEKPVLIHYGSYETACLHRMCERFGRPAERSVADGAIRTHLNLLSVIYAKVYFPCFSNGLKEIAGHLGFHWSECITSGIQSVVQRDDWEISRAPATRQALLTYNSEDCTALEVVSRTLLNLNTRCMEAGRLSVGEVIDTATLKREHPYGFKRNTFAIPELNAINNAAYWDYQREHVYVKSNRHWHRKARQRVGAATSLRPNRIVDCARPTTCPKCSSHTLYKNAKYFKTVIDLRFMRNGIKRWITRYVFHWYRCQHCGVVFPPEEKSWARGKLGPALIAYALYLNIELRLPQVQVDRNLDRLFGFGFRIGQMTQGIKEQASKMYQDCYNVLLKRLCSGRLLHADETHISIRGKDSFVWVFASMDEVAYVYSETREGDLLQGMLKDFKGVLVSDFYAAYDAIPCPQQKCLIHLIRDINDDVLKNPYDGGLKRLALMFAVLLKPMIETIDRHGLKSRYLRKHMAAVDAFYRQMSDLALQSVVAVKLRERFEKNREKLFTFLHFDGVPWNNNNAEHAVKAFAALRHVIGGVTTNKGIREYLILLSVCQTCRYMGVDFLDFLRSGEKDIHAFAVSGHGRGRQSLPAEPNALPPSAPLKP